MNKIYLKEVLPRLKKLFSKHSDIELAILYGSIVERGYSIHDIDIAVKMYERDDKLLSLGEIVVEIADKLNIREDQVDIVDLNNISIPLLWKILKNGIIVKENKSIIKYLKKRVEAYPDINIEIEMWRNFDPNPKIDKNILISRIEEIRRNRDFLKKEILDKRCEELDYKDILAMERAVHRIIESMLDICRHLVSVYSLGLVESYGEYPKKLAEKKIIPQKLAEKLVKLIGLRNILVHRYLKIDTKILYNTSEKICGEIVNQFIDWVKKIDP